MVEPIRKLWSLGLLVGLVVSGTSSLVCGQEAVSRGARQQVPTPPHDANLLERMQDVVAAISKQARSGIVTIQDARTWEIVAQNGEISVRILNQNQTANTVSGSTRVQLQQEIADLQAKIASRDVAIQGLRSKSAVETEREAAQYERDRLAAQLIRARVQLGLLGIGDPARQEKALLEADIALAEVEARHFAMQLQMTQARTKEANGSAGQSPGSMDRAQASEEKLNALRRKLRDVAARYESIPYRLSEPLIETTSDALGNTLASVPKSGSGFSIGEGYILTTADVATGMLNPIATTDAGSQLRLRLVALDPELNVALMRTLNANPLPALPLGDSSTIAPGHFAISIGNQAGQINSVALSMVSGIRTQGFSSTSHFYPALLQIDGVIGVGNSGAPVMNARGEVIGMVAAALANEGEGGSIARSTSANVTIVGQQGLLQSRTTLPGNSASSSANQSQQVLMNGVLPGATRSNILTTSAGLTGFAIPVNSFKCLLPTLKSGVNVVHAWLGTELEETVIVHEQPVGVVTLERKVSVKALYLGGPAAKSGAIRPGDVLVSINGQPVRTANDVRAIVLVQLDPGQKVELQFLRIQNPMTVTLTVEPRPTIMPPLAR